MIKYFTALLLLLSCSPTKKDLHPLVVDYVGALCQSAGIPLYTCNCFLEKLAKDKGEEEIIQLVTKTFSKKTSADESRYLTGTIYICAMVNAANSKRLLNIEGEQL